MQNDCLTLEKLNEAMELIKALSPKQAPEDCWHILGSTGLNIVKNNLMPEDTIVVSKRLFDMIYAASAEGKK
jgi:hypothetical protein